MIFIYNHQTGEKLELSRDVRVIHPQWVHDQLETRSEGELQGFLSQCNVEDWYEGDKHYGPDTCGVEMIRD